jgi:phosphopantetheinyl transferase
MINIEKPKEPYKLYEYTVPKRAAQADVLLSAVLSVLDEREQDRVQLMSDEEAWRFAYIHYWMRGVLGDYLQCSPDKVMYQYEEQGRPVLANNDLLFSLSHTETEACLVVASKGVKAIGVDMELASREHSDPLALAKRFLHPHEESFLQTLSAEDQQEAFGRLWVIKEAALKQDGKGLRNRMQSIYWEPVEKLLYNADGSLSELKVKQWEAEGVKGRESYPDRPMRRIAVAWK